MWRLADAAMYYTQPGFSTGGLCGVLMVDDVHPGDCGHVVPMDDLGGIVEVEPCVSGLEGLRGHT